MRVSEARFLKKEHVDWHNGILTIYASKGQKDRLVYLPQDGVRACLISACGWNFEWIFRQARRIFAVIICLFQENLTKRGGKSAKITAAMRY